MQTETSQQVVRRRAPVQLNPFQLGNRFTKFASHIGENLVEALDQIYDVLLFGCAGSGFCYSLHHIFDAGPKIIG
jgi:hypothetical protein